MPGPDRLPPMQTLSAFESAARLASFTAAARELGSTQPAVSQRIVQLEEYLGAPLFERGHRGVTLTPEGALLYEAVRSGLDTIREATSDIRARRATGALTILTDAGFATYWLMPRLARLKASMPGVNVKIVTSQLGYDPHRDHADIAIAFGDGHWPPCTSTRLFAEAVTPVCSPAFRDLHASVSVAADLAALPLLHVQPTDPERWLAWNTWFAAQGLQAPEDSQGMMFNSYSLVVQAALMGQGVALGWTPLTDELIASGLLVRLLDTPVTTERGYYLVCPPARPAPAAVPLFRRWLFNELIDNGEHVHA
ncbi:choline sulfate utilization transcriptional regulator [Paraburkholderia azotifigens]|uniref:choline sulfate utilization transcriptional regulator n=1 Tax=Paraburkholderia azotifigens TaxID=2057004 RepID=UPI0038B9AC12